MWVTWTFPQELILIVRNIMTPKTVGKTIWRVLRNTWCQVGGSVEKHCFVSCQKNPNAKGHLNRLNSCAPKMRTRKNSKLGNVVQSGWLRLIDIGARVSSSVCFQVFTTWYIFLKTFFKFFVFFIIFYFFGDGSKCLLLGFY